MKRVETLQEQTGEYCPSIVVLGSCFMDYVAYVDHMPQVGETMHSESFQKGFGGKGANQAVAAGRLGARTAMIGMLGGDGDGTDYVAQLQRNGVDTRFMFRDAQSASGLAMILVDTKSSNNEIVICPNATRLLTVALLRERTANYAKIFTPSVKYFICQNEIPLATTLDALRAAHQRGIYTIFNAAPAPTRAEVEIITPYLPFVSLFCPNEIEAAMITGLPVRDVASAFEAIKALHKLGIRDVVITLGAAGFALSENGAPPVHVCGRRVRAVDTTGAGDCFVGSLVYFMSCGHDLLESCTRANACAAISVTRKGTQVSYPTRDELPDDVLRST